MQYNTSNSELNIDMRTYKVSDIQQCDGYIALVTWFNDEERILDYQPIHLDGNNTLNLIFNISEDRLRKLCRVAYFPYIKGDIITNEELGI